LKSKKKKIESNKSETKKIISISAAKTIPVVPNKVIQPKVANVDNTSTGKMKVVVEAKNPNEISVKNPTNNIATAAMNTKSSAPAQPAKANPNEIGRKTLNQNIQNNFNNSPKQLEEDEEGFQYLLDLEKSYSTGKKRNLSSMISKVRETEEDEEANGDVIQMGSFVRRQVANGCFLIAASLFLTGFMMLVDVNLKRNNGDMRLYGPLSLQMLAAAFFTIKPLTTIMRFMSHKEPDKSMRYPNLFGAIFFHVANMMALAFSYQSISFVGYDSTSGYHNSAKQNTALLLIVLATSFLLAANGRIVDETKISKNTVMGYTAAGNLLLIVGYSLFRF